MPDSPNGNSTALKAHACVLCQRRKVKCNRREPCASCAKARVDCEYRAPLPPRRRKRKDPESALAARIQHYEYALRKAGIDLSSVEPDRPQKLNSINTVESESSQGTPRPRGNPSIFSDATPGNTSRPGSGRLVTRKGRSLYLDNHLWKSVSHEV
ncbi:hypothetical protein TSTA_029660 [Talaromyces stipitatus ATCC 10500]|uniref:Zn(2)-C6 fungal-type domain-containing protein n=1 Tax=Talaromyces stipitatus (strain ATCC 10500 / CBS 375.48 / QM 6759 / NRRL 1006) TaxID=441959 RepID=B8M586_TALSN|nr:uncharacterized protein TSTA_029660 [Talaromyces stipitatus ATCC 10500]EED19692.1 hypothetical protein TSTA_029660 [Talaromyces stipitatus ATCC 10500]